MTPENNNSASNQSKLITSEVSSMHYTPEETVKPQYAQQTRYYPAPNILKNQKGRKAQRDKGKKFNVKLGGLNLNYEMQRKLSFQKKAVHEYQPKLQ